MTSTYTTKLLMLTTNLALARGERLVGSSNNCAVGAYENSHRKI